MSQTAIEALASAGEVKAADANLERIREIALDEISMTLERMQAIGAELGSNPNAALLSEMHALSDTVAGVASAFGLAHVGAVARSLCELADRLRHSGCFKAAAIQVHLDSLRWMHAASPQDIRRAALVQDALQQVVDSIPRQAASL